MTDVREDHGSPPPIPAWVKVFGVLAIAVLVLLVVLLVFGGGRHGPGRHFGAPERPPHGDVR